MNPDKTTRRRVPVLKLRVDLTDYPSTIERVIELAHSGRGGYISVANVHVAIEAQDDPAFSDLVNDADLVLPDGTPLVWMQRCARIHPGLGAGFCLIKLEHFDRGE